MNATKQGVSDCW